MRPSLSEAVRDKDRQNRPSREERHDSTHLGSVDVTAEKVERRGNVPDEAAGDHRRAVHGENHVRAISAY
jgi:hypothetical protein